MAPGERWENKNRKEILAAIGKVACLSSLLPPDEESYDHEIDLEVIVYGRSYGGKPVGPYVRLWTYPEGSTILLQGDQTDNTFYVVVEGHVNVYTTAADGRETKIDRLEVGKEFGIKSLLTGSPRLATVKAPPDAKVQLLEIRRPAIRLLRKLPNFAGHVDQIYREHGHNMAINNFIKVTGLAEKWRKDLEEVSVFRALDKNHTLFEQGTWNSQLFLILKGGVRRQSSIQGGVVTDFLRENYCLGLESATGEAHYGYTATITGLAEVLEINLIKLRRNKPFEEALVPILLRFDPPRLRRAPEADKPPIVPNRFSAQEALIATGLVDANNLLIMDMDLCVRCGNCSLACDRVHGRSRLTRQGIHITRPSPRNPKAVQSLLAPSVCLHCNDPECLVGCPTGAIGRGEGGEIDIAPALCIGCGDCVAQCPYHAISLVPVTDLAPPGSENGKKAARGARRLPLQKVDLAGEYVAIKCNLCSDRKSLNPDGHTNRVYSCEENCPTGALIRVKPREYFEEIGTIENLQAIDHNRAIGRNIHVADPPKRWIHGVGLLLLILLPALTVGALRQYGYGRGLGGVANLRWLTGIGGLFFILVALSYSARRAVYRKRRGPLRYWMLVHSYAGVLGCLLILLHGGGRPGELLTTALTLAFDAVILTGLFGLGCYLLVPRLLTRIEGTPLLVEDLERRQRELREEMAQILDGSSPTLRSVIAQEVVPCFRTFNLRVRQYRKRESIEQLFEWAETEFQKIAAGLPDPQERTELMRAVRCAATLCRVKALLTLHRLLKGWLMPHWVLSGLMTWLLVAHMIQVIYARW